MEIVEYTPDMLGSLTQCYNRLIADVPHCYPVNEDEFGEELSNMPEIGHPQIRYHSQITFIASSEVGGRQDDEVLGFVQIGINELRQHKRNNGVIRFLGYLPGERRAGQALLEKAESYLQMYNATQIVAFMQEHRYHFYHFAHAYLSDALGQNQALLGFNGYKRSEGEVFLAWENYEVTLPPLSLPVEIAVEWKSGRGKRPNCKVQARRDGEEIGVCESLSCGEFSSHPDTQDWFHTVWLGIEDEFQGQGLGRYLLQYTLHEMHNVGYRHAAISTDWENHRAFLFYSNFGYRVSDWTYGFSKTMS